MPTIMKWINLIVGTVLVLAAGIFCLFWFVFRVYVPPDKCLVLIRKMGRAPEAGQVIAKPGEKGIQEQALEPGRYFYNPYVWDWELHDLVKIDAGDSTTWKWLHTVQYHYTPGAKGDRRVTQGNLPMVGVVKRLVGPEDPQGREVVPKGYKGIQEKVLTPGVYRLNPYIFKVQTHPATVVPPGFVGVVTSNVGTDPEEITVTRPAVTTREQTRPAQPTRVRKLAVRGQRGILKDILQPGIYYLNPIQYTVNLIEVGYNELSQIKRSEQVNDRITFPSSDGFGIAVGVTVIWGRNPKNAPKIVNEFGSVQNVLDRVVLPQLRSICRLIGSTYQAKDFIEGEKREEFQTAMTERLRTVCQAKNIEILLALVRAIEVTATGDKGGVDIKKTIQARYIANEEELTRERERDAAEVKADLEQAEKQIDIARETVAAETRKLVADIQAEAQKNAAETDAEKDLKVAEIQQKVAELEAQRTRTLGKAEAEVTRLSEQAEADGYTMLVGALGGGEAYNLYTFARQFEPKDIRLFFAGPGTFWTDLKRFEEVGAAKLLAPSGAARSKVSPAPPGTRRRPKPSSVPLGPPEQPVGQSGNAPAD